MVAVLLIPVQPGGDATIVPVGIVSPVGMTSVKYAFEMAVGYVLVMVRVNVVVSPTLSDAAPNAFLNGLSITVTVAGGTLRSGRPVAVTTKRGFCWGPRTVPLTVTAYVHAVKVALLAGIVPPVREIVVLVALMVPVQTEGAVTPETMVNPVGTVSENATPV